MILAYFVPKTEEKPQGKPADKKPQDNVKRDDRRRNYRVCDSKGAVSDTKVWYFLDCFQRMDEYKHEQQRQMIS